MKAAVFASVLAVVSAGGSVKISWKDCGSKHTHGKTTELKPSTIKLGDNTEMTGSGTVDKKVSGGSFTIEAKAGGGIIHQKFDGNNCEAKTFNLPLNVGTITWDGLKCPMPAGKASIGFHVKLSASIPASLAKSTIAMKAVDQDKEDLLCVNVETTASSDAIKYARGFVRQARNGPVEVGTITAEDRAAAPDSLDWSTKGATTPVKDQGGCGSCWAYSATQGIESGLYMATGKLEQLAEQQIISCDKTDSGCGGGDLPTAFDYVKQAGGIASQEDYPDTSSQSADSGRCESDHQPVAKVTGWKYAVPPCESGSCENQDEDGLMAALNKFGPLSVCVNAVPWDSYSGGIFSGRCSGAAAELDHCVQLVGYDKTQSYWKVRNSWADQWGEAGFIRLPMGQNACGIADEATYVEAALVSGAIEV